MLYNGRTDVYMMMYMRGTWDKGQVGFFLIRRWNGWHTKRAVCVVG